MESAYNMLYKYQKYLFGVALFLMLFAISFEIIDQSIELIWRKFPMVALLILIAGLLLLILYIQLDKYHIHRLTNPLKEQKDDGLQNQLETLETLTDRQRQVYDLIISGKSNKEITGALFIEPSTLKTHINQIYKKLDIKNRKALKSISRLKTK
jgi:DNA-binding NarL/FixJ family response regulator